MFPFQSQIKVLKYQSKRFKNESKKDETFSKVNVKSHVEVSKLKF